MNVSPIARNLIPSNIAFRDGKYKNEVIIDFQDSQIGAVHDDDFIKCVGALVRAGFRIAIDCGIKSIQLGRYALTHVDERINADRLFSGPVADTIKIRAGRRVNITEEFRRAFIRKHIFVVYEPK